MNKPRGKPLQARFPWLWLTVQYLIAGYFDRGRHILRHYAGHGRVLEVGCSVGIDSGRFVGQPCSYLGIDIDEDAIRMARHRHGRHAHMRFLATDLRDLDSAEGRFDFILFCGTCHHIPDAQLRSILAQAADRLEEGGSLVVIDYAVPANPGLLERLILLMEEGTHIRPQQEILHLLLGIEGLEMVEMDVFRNAAFLFPWPVMAHKFCIHMKKRQTTLV